MIKPHQSALLVAVSAAQGLSFVAIRTGVEEMPPLMLTGYRYFFAFFPLCFFLARPVSVPLRTFAVFGLIQGAVVFGALITGIAMGLPAGLASIVIQTQVFFTIFLAFVFLKERPTAAQKIAIFVAFIGMAIIGYDKLQSASFAAFLLVIFGGLAWGGANIISKQAHPEKPLNFVVWSSAFAPIPLFLGSMVLDGSNFAIPDAVPSLKLVASIAFMAYFATVFAFYGWVSMLNICSSNEVMPYGLLIPIFGFCSVALVYGESLSVMTAIGAALVFISLVTSNFSGTLDRLLMGTSAQGDQR